jgi:hypothetical protein
VISAVALLLGALLNAQGIYKTAFNQSDGWQRDVALALADPLRDVSHVLWLDRPRETVKAVLGRSDDDRIDTEIALPPVETKPPPSRGQTPRTTPAPVRPAVPTPRKVAFSPKRKLRLWVAGDSLVITPGYAIVRAAGGSPAIESVGGVDGRVATGLTRPDVFNWFSHIQTQVTELKPRAVVLGFGGNDDKAYMTGLPEGVSIGEFGDPAWRREYGRRVGGLMDALARQGVFVVWIGLPITRSPEQTQRFDQVNAVVQREVARREGQVAFVDTYTTFAGDDGGYTQYLRGASGRTQEVRAPDGVHFATAGGDIIAREVLRALNRQFDLVSWRKRQQAASAP